VRINVIDGATVVGEFDEAPDGLGALSLGALGRGCSNSSSD
jgi:hypothetical protein